MTLKPLLITSIVLGVTTLCLFVYFRTTRLTLDQECQVRFGFEYRYIREAKGCVEVKRL